MGAVRPYVAVFLALLFLQSVSASILEDFANFFAVLFGGGENASTTAPEIGPEDVNRSPAGAPEIGPEDVDSSPGAPEIGPEDTEDSPAGAPEIGPEDVDSFPGEVIEPEEPQPEFKVITDEKEPASCGVCLTDFRLDPVCGVDGNTYINEQGALLSGVEVAYKGYCEEFPFKVIEPEKDFTEVKPNGTLGVIEPEKYCEDTDAGKEPYMPGKVFTESGEYADSCFAGEIGGGTLTEYYCDDDEVKKVVVQCNAGCAPTGDACAKEEPKNASFEGCVDSDGGDVPEVYGTVNLSGIVFEDTCESKAYKIGSSSVLKEYFCTAGDVDSKEYYCDECSQGVCIQYGGTAPEINDTQDESNNTLGDIITPQTSTGLTLGCIDSEEDVDAYVKGQVTYEGVVYEDQCLYNEQGFPYAVVDYYCGQNGTLEFIQLDCEGSCYDGACGFG